MKKFQAVVEYVFCTIAIIGIFGMCFMCEDSKSQIIWSTCCFGVCLLSCAGAFITKHFQNVCKLIRIFFEFAVCFLAYVLAPKSTIGKSVRSFVKNNSWFELFDNLCSDEVEMN